MQTSKHMQRPPQPNQALESTPLNPLSSSVGISGADGERFAIELCGPWPAYSFCDEPQGPAAAGQGGIHAVPC